MEGFFLNFQKTIIKRSSALVIREVKIEITMSYLHIATKMANVKKKDTTKIN